MNELKKHIETRIIYLKGVEYDYFDKSQCKAYSDVTKKMYRIFSNEFNSRRNELEQLLPFLNEETRP